MGAAHWTLTVHTDGELSDLGTAPNGAGKYDLSPLVKIFGEKVTLVNAPEMVYSYTANFTENTVTIRSSRWKPTVYIVARYVTTEG